jgi:thymidine kinase
MNLVNVSRSAYLEIIIGPMFSGKTSKGAIKPDKNTKNNIFKCAVLAGHYNFNKKTYNELLKKLKQIYLDNKEKLINFHYETIEHYVNNFYYE